MSLGEDPLDIDIDQLLRESARAAAEFDSAESDESQQPVSYTHLTLPTIYSV